MGRKLRQGPKGPKLQLRINGTGKHTGNVADSHTFWTRITPKELGIMSFSEHSIIGNTNATLPGTTGSAP